MYYYYYYYCMLFPIARALAPLTQPCLGLSLPRPGWTLGTIA